jgi:hypothetical protein
VSRDIIGPYDHTHSLFHLVHSACVFCMVHSACVFCLYYLNFITVLLFDRWASGIQSSIGST